MAVGRISGPLLKANLLRDGVDLAFETDLLYLDVVNGRVGINTGAPAYDLDVNGTTRTTNAVVDTQADIASFTVTGNTISSTNSTINLEPSGANAVVYQGKLLVNNNLQITTNEILATNTDANLEFRTLGTGQVNVNSNVWVDGNIHATGTITADGNIEIGDGNTDNVTFNADIASNIVPDNQAPLYAPLYDLGSLTKAWKTVYTQNVEATTINTGSIVVDGIDLALPQGNIIYVATTGSDSNLGVHEHNPVKTIEHAFNIAVAGDTIYVFPGVYEERFPLEVPSGVTVHGASLRSVTIKPTAATMYLDAFHMNGEATVEDLTIMGFHHDATGTLPEFIDNSQGTGHAFRFSAGTLTNTRSPYIRNITVLTFGTASVSSVASITTEVVGTLTRIKNVIADIVTNVAVSATIGNGQTQNTILDDSDVSTGTLLQGLIDDVVYIINNGTLKASLPTITANGAEVTSGMLANAAAILEANRNWIIDEAYAYPTYTYSPTTFDETLTKRDMGLVLDALIYDIVRGGNEHSVYAGLGYWVQPANDPRGYARGDAGHGALVDGSAVLAASKEAAMLFHSVTFITPGADTLIATNGARVEWLNSFTYFAGKGLYAYSTNVGFAGAGLTRLRINNKVGTWAIGNTVTYYDTDGTTVLATGVIDSLDGNFVNLTGRCLGFETITDRVGKQVYPQGDAKLSVTQKKFGNTSLALDGTGDYATVASTQDFGFGTADFTIEFWVYRNDSGRTEGFLDFKTANPQVTPNLYAVGTNLYYFTNGSARITGTAALPNASTWYHIAVSRVSGNTIMFVDGAQVGSTYVDTNDYITTQLVIGNNYVYTAGLDGYIDDLRITKNLGRYSSTFVRPTTAFVGDLNTVLLLHFNGNNNSTTFLDDGVTYQDLRTDALGTASIINFADYSDFGAEIRSIGSANVYGEYGAYGDGPGVIAYLISQNFAYVGAEELVTNDPNDRIGANEVVELNGAHIYRTSVDNEGNFQVGNNFYINQKTGEVLFDSENLTVTSATGVTFTDGVHTTTITSTDITTGNIKIHDNNIDSLTGDIIVTAASGAINLQNNTFITGALDVTGDINIGGNITIGNESTDTISFVAGISSNLVPATTASYDLGTDLLRWNTAFLSRAEIDGLVIDNNIISTTLNDDDLQLTANGTGRVYIPSNDVQIDQNLNVDGTTTLHDTSITGTLTQTGDVTQTGDYTQTGNVEITGNLTVSTFAQFEKIRIDSNVISTTATDTDLKLEAAGTGRIYVPSDNVLIDNDLTVNGVATFGTLSVTNTVTANAFSTGDILIDDNYITTTITDHNLELRANGTGKILVPSNDVQFDQNLTVNQNLTVTTGTTYLKAVGITGDVTQTGDINQTGNLTTSGAFDVTGHITSTGYLQLPQVRIENNVVSTTVTDTNLELQANGTGNVIIEGIKVQDNNIQSIVTDSNIVLTPQGTGSVVVNSTTSLQIPVGTTLVTGVNGDIRYNTTKNRYEGFSGSYWQTLSGVEDVDGNTKILAEATPGANDNTLYFYADGSLMVTIDSTKLFAERLQTTNLDLSENTISSITLDSDLNLTATGTGAVKFGNLKIYNNTITNVSTNAVTEFVQTGTGYVKIAGTNGVVIPSGDGYLERPLVAEVGMTRFNTDGNLVEVFNGVTWGSVAGSSGGVTSIEANGIGIASALIFG